MWTTLLAFLVNSCQQAGLVTGKGRGLDGHHAACGTRPQPVELLAAQATSFGLQGHNVRGLQTFGALLDGKLDALSFIQRFETLRLDGCIVDEHVVGALSRDKAVALGTIEPFHGSDFTFTLTHGLAFFLS